MLAMYASNAIMPHVTTPEYNSRIIYQGVQLQSGSSASVGNFHDSSMNYFNYPNMQSYPGEFQSNSVQLSVGSQRSNTMDDRSSSNYPNLPTSRNPFANSVTSSHEYFALENMDNRESFACQQSASQGQPNVRRINRSPFDSGRKSRSWTDAVFASMDREAESILELVNEDAMELERIAATIKQDCKSPNSAPDTLLASDYAPISLPSVGPVNDLSFPRWTRPQYSDVLHRRKRSPRSDTHYLPDDYVLSSDFQTFSLDSPPGQDFRYGDLYGLPNAVGHFASNPNLGGYVRNGFPHQHSFLSDLQTYHGASTYSSYRQNFATDNMRPGSEVMLGEASRSFYKPCLKDRGDRSKAKHGETHDDIKRFGETNKTGSKSRNRGDSKAKMCLSDEYKGILGKRKSDHTDEDGMQHKKPKFYFEREEHYIVHKLLRELSSSIAPSELPRTTSASLFYRLLSSKAEPRIMQTVGGTTTSGRSRKIVVRDDVSEDEIGKYSHVGSHPFIYIQGAASRGSPTKSSKLIELLTTKSPVAKEEVNGESNEESASRKEKSTVENGVEQGGENGQQNDDESTSDPIR